MVHVFLHLILSANHEDGRWQGHEVRRGQLITGRKALCEETGISEQSIRTCLKNLRKTGEINQQTNQRFSIITINKYNEYQEKDFAANQQINQQSTSSQPAANHKQEGEEGKEEKNILSGSPPDRALKPPFSTIVSFLNEKAGTAFKPTTHATKAHIRARWAEGFRLEDFQTVISHRCDEWLTDGKMREFLRPQTLFGTKFESYLQAAKAHPAGDTNLYGKFGKWKEKEPSAGPR